MRSYLHSQKAEAVRRTHARRRYIHRTKTRRSRTYRCRRTAPAIVRTVPGQNRRIKRPDIQHSHDDAGGRRLQRFHRRHDPLRAGQRRIRRCTHFRCIRADARGNGQRIHAGAFRRCPRRFKPPPLNTHRYPHGFPVGSGKLRGVR